MFVQPKLAGTGRHQRCQHLKVDSERKIGVDHKVSILLPHTLLKDWHCSCSPHRTSASLQVIKADVGAGEMLQDWAGNTNGAKKREMGPNVPLSHHP